MDTAGGVRKDGEEFWTVLMVKLGKKHLHLQFSNALELLGFTSLCPVVAGSP